MMWSLLGKSQSETGIDIQIFIETVVTSSNESNTHFVQISFRPVHIEKFVVLYAKPGVGDPRLFGAPLELFKNV